MLLLPVLSEVAACLRNRLPVLNSVLWDSFAAGKRPSKRPILNGLPTSCSAAGGLTDALHGLAYTALALQCHQHSFSTKYVAAGRHSAPAQGGLATKVGVVMRCSGARSDRPWSGLTFHFPSLAHRFSDGHLEELSLSTLHMYL